VGGAFLKIRCSVVACSTTESEYIAAYTATREAICLRRMLIELGETSVDTAVDLNEDNQACIKLAHNPCSAQRTKSMDVKYHFLRQAVQEGKINLKYVDTKKQLADIFTKQLPVTQFGKLRTAIGWLRVGMWFEELTARRGTPLSCSRRYAEAPD
jgi:hypothetical protein